MNHYQVTIAVTDPGQQEIVIALLTGLGYEGFEQQENALLAFLPEAGFDAHDWTPSVVRGPVGTAPFTGIFTQRTRVDEHVVVPVSVPVPVLLGAGIPLLPPPTGETKLELLGHKMYGTGIVSLQYAIKSETRS